MIGGGSKLKIAPLDVLSKPLLLFYDIELEYYLCYKISRG